MDENSKLKKGIINGCLLSIPIWLCIIAACINLYARYLGY